MINVLLVGCLGRMGRTISNYIRQLDDVNIIAGIDSNFDVISDESLYPVYNNFQDIVDDNVKADVVIDFSNISALNELLKYCDTTCSPLVLGTTGMDKEDIEKIKSFSMNIPIFISANMSFGVNLIGKLCEDIVRLSGDIYDVDIIEKHHHNKIDAPSGTANMFANIIIDAYKHCCMNKKVIECNRIDCKDKRNKDTIDIHCIRAGNSIGEHKIVFACDDEVLEISHKVSSKNVFAKGAINAAKFIINKNMGIYDVNNLFFS